MHQSPMMPTRFYRDSSRLNPETLSLELQLARLVQRIRVDKAMHFRRRGKVEDAEQYANVCRAFMPLLSLYPRSCQISQSLK